MSVGRPSTMRPVEVRGGGSAQVVAGVVAAVVISAALIWGGYALLSWLLS